MCISYLQPAKAYICTDAHPVSYEDLSVFSERHPRGSLRGWAAHCRNTELLCRTKKSNQDYPQESGKAEH